MRLNDLWSRIVERKANKARQNKAAKQNVRLAIEALEERSTPAQLTWNVPATSTTNTNWNVVGNWTTDDPTHKIPRAGDALLFPALTSAGQPALRTTNNNIVGLSVNSITFGGSGYTVTGSPFQVTGEIVNSAVSIPGLTENRINNQISVVAGDRSVALRAPNSGSILVLGGPLVGGGTLGLNKSGPGTVVLAGNNINFTGEITIASGPLNISHPNALGSTGGETTVQIDRSNPSNPVYGQLGILGNIRVIAEPLILNGPGPSDRGALVNVSGNNTWTGTIRLDSNATIGALDGDPTTTAIEGSLTIEGIISSSGLFGFTKEGPATIILDPLRSALGNTYGGRTFVNQGILAIRHSRALGSSTTTMVGINDTVVSSTPEKSGTLQLDFVPNAARIDYDAVRATPTAAPTGFTVPFEALTLNGPGWQGIHTKPKTQGVPPTSQTVYGALHNNRGNNSWTQDVSLWSGDSTATNFNVRYWDWGTVGIGVEANTTLTLTGNVNDDNLSTSLVDPSLTTVEYSLIKTRPGRLILTGEQTKQPNGTIIVSPNTYRGRTEVLEGYLNIRDSHALGATGFEENGTTVFTGGTLELEADSLADSNPGGVSPDGKQHLTTDLVIGAERLFLQGTGADSTGSSGKGALRNIRGTNEITGDIPLLNDIYRGTLEGFVRFASRGVWIGVEPDLYPTDPANPKVPFNAFNLSQLTLSGTLLTGRDIYGFIQTGPFVANPADLFKTGAGELVLTADQNGSTGNTYVGVTYIMQGWITARSDRALGGDIPSRSQTVQPGTHVAEGAALVLKQTRGTNLAIDLTENLWLAGDGISHRFDALNHNGALLNLSGDNVVSGEVNLIAKTDYVRAGIGADVDPLEPVANIPSEVTLTGKVGQTPLWAYPVYRSDNIAGAAQDYYLIDTGSISGTLQISYNFGPNVGANPNQLTVYYEGQKIADSGIVSGAGTLSVPYGAGDTSFVEVRMNEGTGGYGGDWEYNVTVVPTDRDAGITKFGRRRASLQGPGTYAGDVVVAEGTLRARHDTALGIGLKPLPGSSADLRPGTTTVQNGTSLELDAALPESNGGIGEGIQIRDNVVLSGPGLAETQRVKVQGTGGTFTLTVFNPATNSYKTTAKLPYNATAAQVAAALNAVATRYTLPVLGTGAVTVTLATDVTTTPYTNYYTITFVGTTVVGRNLPTMTVTPYADPKTPANLPTVGISTVTDGGTATLANLGQDNQILGAMSFLVPPSSQPPIPPNSSVIIDTATDSRLALRGNINGAGGMVKLGDGKLVLAGNNSYGGSTQVRAGIINVQSSSALGLPGTSPTAGGTVVSPNAGLEVQGGINVGAEPLAILGDGPDVSPDVPLRWFSQGVGPVLNGQTTSTNNLTGRVTGVATDPSDPNVMYVTTSTGGSWRTRDNGLSWEPLIDQVNDDQGQPIYTDQTMFTGAIVVAPTRPNTLYIGLGDPNNSLESYYGTGILKSDDYGDSWTLLQAPNNAFTRSSIARIVVDPHEADTIYVAVQGNATNGASGGNVGLWRYRNGTWVDLSASAPTLVGSAVTDVMVLDSESPIYNPNNRIIAFATSDYITGLGNTVYTSIDAAVTSNAPTWDDLAFNPAVEDFTGRTGRVYRQRPMYGQIKLTGNRYDANPSDPSSEVLFTLYASVAYPVNVERDDQGTSGQFRTVRKTELSWWPGRPTPIWVTPAWGDMGSQPGNYMGGTQPSYPYNNSGFPGIRGAGWYASTIEVDPNDRNLVFVGGLGQATGLNGQPTYVGPYIWDGSAWHDVGSDASAPHVNYHDAIFDGRGRLLVGTDGGIWARPASGVTGAAIDSTTWTNMNGNFLNTAEMTGVDVDPNNPFVLVGGTLTDGTAVINDKGYWKATDGASGGQVRIDNNYPNIVYHYQDGYLRRSTDGGQTWTSIYADTYTGAIPGNNGYTNGPIGDIMPFPYLLEQQYDTEWDRSNGLPFYVDPLDPTRVFIVARDNLNGNGSFTDFLPNVPIFLEHSMLKVANVQNNNPTFVNIGDSDKGFGRIISISVAGYQGTYAADPDFLSTVVPDLGSDARDVNTIYVLTNDGLFVTKNGGQLWVERDAGLGQMSDYSEVVVDRRNRDTAYVVRHRFNGVSSGQIFRTTDGGVTWLDISGSLPDLPAWKVVVNPTNGDLYLGNDNGVYRLSGVNNAANDFSKWERLGVGMPNVQVKQMVFSPLTNVLTAGTFGRGVFQMWLDPSLTDTEASLANQGAIRVVSGRSTWGGTLTMTSDLLIDVAKGAELDFTAPITDGTNTYNITKVGEGRVIFSGANDYGGLTDVQEGFLTVNNPRALGAATTTGKYVGGVLNGVRNDTIVHAGATLEMQSDLLLERVELNGDGMTFSGKPLGALRNVSSPAAGNTFTGTLVLATDSTITVESGSQLTIGSRAGLAGVGIITDEVNPANPPPGDIFGFTKEGLGTLVLNTRNSYDGATTVSQGTLVITQGSLNGLSSLGSIRGGTDVQDGAQLQMVGNLSVVGEKLELSGAGIRGVNGQFTGALLVSGISTWSEQVTLDAPPAQAWINVTSTTGSLTLPQVVDGDGGLYKIGPGRLYLTAANTYTGLTTVAGGVVQITTTSGLGTSATGTEVKSGAALELNLPTGTNTLDEAFTLLGSGIAPGNAGVLLNLRGTNTLTGNLLLLANSTLSVNPSTELTLTGIIRDDDPATPATELPSGLTKKGTGKLTITNAGNTFLGATVITGGTVQIDGTAANVQVGGGTVLSGSGTVGAISRLAGSAAAAVVSPGTPAGIPGQLKSAGGTWNGYTTFAVNLNNPTMGTGYDQLEVRGNLNLGGARLSVTALPNIPLNSQFIIVQATGSAQITGKFAGLTTNGARVLLGGQYFRINYTTTAVTLTRVQ